jgi:peptidoglycan/LPS O-acetylase OafA/YrhL
MTSTETFREPFHGHIAALDGLRFVAAATVLFSHGYFYLILFQQNQNITPYNAPFVGLSTIGMSLFFVLSGFVIHYSYSSTISRPGGRRAFFVARFARLYPLFLIVFVISTFYAVLDTDGKADVIGPIPLYLTFTESWWFWVFGDHAASEAYSNATGLMWSLSTEAFFYMLYPLLAPALRRLMGWKLLVVGATVATVGACVAFELTEYRGYLNNWVAFYTGNPLAAQGFSHWLIFNSPWVRIFEFLLGALAAQYVMTATVRPTWAMIVGVFSSAVILSAYLYCNIRLIPLGGAITTCVAGMIALLVGAAAIKGHAISRVFSNRVMVFGGEASYSLYLLHYWVMHNLGHRLADSQPLAARYGLFLVLMIVSVAVARFSYVFFERPMIRVIRSLFKVKSRGVAPRTGISEINESVSMGESQIARKAN